MIGIEVIGFEMNVFDVFHFASGDTVFVGLVQGREKLISKCKVEMLLDGNVIKIISLNGEWITNKRHPEGHRAISTIEPINLTSELVTKHDCKLRRVSTPS